MLAEPEDATLITAELPASFSEALAADDPNGVVPRFLVDAVPNATYSLSDYDTVPAPVAEPLEDGALIELGDRSFEVIHLPGHTPGSAGLYERRTGVLFTGDVLYEGELLDELPESNIDDYVRSMRRLAALDVSVAYPGHGDPLTAADVQRLSVAYLQRRSPQ
jgi:glyoxylase-like metal-dependent hydrolase (beta-lactamase superfamily II)